MGAPAAFAITTLIVTAVQTGLTVKAAEDAKADADFEANQEREAARERQIERLKDLRRIQGEQTVSQAGAGLSLESASFRAIEEDLLQNFRADQAADALNTSTLVGRLQSRGRNARTTGFIQGATTLAGGAATAANTGRTPAARQTSIQQLKGRFQR